MNLKDIVKSSVYFVKYLVEEDDDSWTIYKKHDKPVVYKQRYDAIQAASSLLKGENGKYPVFACQIVDIVVNQKYQTDKTLSMQELIQKTKQRKDILQRN